MTKQEQIEEIQKIIDDSWEFSSISAELGSGDGDINVEEAAKALYDAGYRKVDDLKAENKQLKTECALLDDELRIARQETIDVLNELWEKVKDEGVDYKIGMRALSEEIDELIKEQLKK